MIHFQFHMKVLFFQLVVHLSGQYTSCLLLSGLDFLKIVSFSFGIAQFCSFDNAGHEFFCWSAIASNARGKCILVCFELHLHLVLLDGCVFNYVLQRCFSVVFHFQKEEVIIPIQSWNNFGVLQYLAL